MAQLVHVIKETGTRWEFHFPDEASPEAILAELDHHARLFGFDKANMGIDPQTNLTALLADPNSGLVIKNPKTIVAVGQVVNGKFVETKRLRGAVPTRAE